MNLSVLQNATAADVRAKPFPHLILHDALPAEICDALIEHYPDPTLYGIDLSQNNIRYDYPAYKAATDERIPAVWREVLAYHSSPAFYADVLRVFGDQILRLYGQRFESLEQLASLRTGVRGADDFTDKDVLLEAQLSGNTPVREICAVRGLHIDKGDKLFSGLLYLRPDGDNSMGGDLEIRRFKSGMSAEKKQRKVHFDFSIEDRHTELVSTVRYEKNVLVLFINTLESLHAVTPRAPTDKLRLFMNIVAEVVAPPLYMPRPLDTQETAIPPEPIWRRAASRLRRNVTRVLRS